MNNFIFKFTVTLGIMLLAITANAQTVPVCQNDTKNYTVDIQAPDGASPDGTPGSTYEWSILEPGFTGTLTVTNGNSNKAEIVWQTPVGIYTIQVIETNGTCEGTPITFEVEVIAGPTTPTVTPETPICSGDDAIFEIAGAPGSVVTYNINGGPDQTVTIGAGGTVDVVENGVTADTTITITSIANSADPGACSSSVNVTATVVVTAQPTTSPIIAL